MEGLGKRPRGGRAGRPQPLPPPLPPCAGGEHHYFPLPLATCTNNSPCHRCLGSLMGPFHSPLEPAPELCPALTRWTHCCTPLDAHLAAGPNCGGTVRACPPGKGKLWFLRSPPLGGRGCQRDAPQQIPTDVCVLRGAGSSSPQMVSTASVVAQASELGRRGFVVCKRGWGSPHTILCFAIATWQEDKNHWTPRRHLLQNPASKQSIVIGRKHSDCCLLPDLSSRKTRARAAGGVSNAITKTR